MRVVKPIHLLRTTLLPPRTNSNQPMGNMNQRGLNLIQIGTPMGLLSLGCDGGGGFAWRQLARATRARRLALNVILASPFAGGGAYPGAATGKIGSRWAADESGSQPCHSLLTSDRGGTFRSLDR